ncbi:hypothetical protein PEX1_065450 [Penicillium expansum]|uniref:DUF6606 domain-containing protein n=1 Tax=Penicillium expansum TaxID=27334 RepID=A0A0A2IWK5_PENEN|nr:hypothetical protein PEX2_032120 [Penicillium expansum]KGO47497.1 hypothetical protein PEXP_013840 [Penicillium expansum]KGO54435.1 hypothetical protein PEX2_032120 [Penicillium expansum]KGO65162.1 hypothetical protein PEX1_065450 [Penicillium expansum]
MVVRALRFGKKISSKESHQKQDPGPCSKLAKALTELETHGGLLPIYVRQQNAAILITHRDNVVKIESFELSSRNESIITTVGRLQRIFLCLTLTMDLTTFNNKGFRDMIAQTIAQMSSQFVKKFYQKYDEDRDTTRPKMVTDFMMAVLRPRCSEVNTLQIQKNTREEVLQLNTRFPWRRSAMWLMVRVVLQLTFCRLSVL